MRTLLSRGSASFALIAAIAVISHLLIASSFMRHSSGLTDRSSVFSDASSVFTPRSSETETAASGTTTSASALGDAVEPDVSTPRLFGPGFETPSLAVGLEIGHPCPITVPPPLTP